MGCALNLESYYEHQRDWSFFEEKHRTEYVYDASGNITYKSNKSSGVSYVFEYSALNQLKKATVTSSALGGNILKSIEYKYDPLGHRIMRQVVDNVDPQKSSLKKYYYDGVNIIAELDAVDNLTASYTYSPLRADDILGAKFTSYATGDSAISEGQLLSQTAGAVYYLKDHLNTINEIVNDAGDIIQKMDYSAYGVLRSVKDSGGHELGFGNAPVRTSFSYTGREFEPELNIYYYRARYYDPSTGRFLQQDPDPGKLASPITFLSKYIYAGNNPILYSDPSGAAFGWDDLAYLILYTAAASAIQAEFQVHNGGDSNYHKNFWNNFAINLVTSLIGVAFSGGGDFKMGWGGLYDTTANSTGSAYSAGFFQNTASDMFSSATYRHEVGHTINFFISGLFWSGDLGERAKSAGIFYSLHGLGSRGPYTEYSPITTITEGGADVWSGYWYHFKEIKSYQPYWR